MTDTNKLGAFDFSFDPMLDETGLLDGTGLAGAQREAPDQDGLFLPNTEGRTEFLAPDPDKVPVIENTVKQDSAEYASRPAKDRTRELFAQMRPQRKALLGIVDAARKPFPMGKMEEAMAKRSEKKFSLYSPANLCSMLETAGALEKVTEDGLPYDSREMKPDIVVVDGDEYYVPTCPPEVHWLSTRAGLEMLGEDEPLDKVEMLFEHEADLLGIYKRLLTMMAVDDGAQMKEMSDAVDADPLICEPRRFFVQHFVESLERCGAVVWLDSSWRITDLGRDALALLDGVADDYVVPEQHETTSAFPTETDGINW